MYIPNDDHNLDLYTENEGKLYPLRKVIIAAMMKKMAQGTYSAATAAKFWLRWFDEGAKRYAREDEEFRGRKWNEVFPLALRKHLAVEQTKHEFMKIKNGEYGPLPKKTVAKAKKTRSRRRR